jgi:hypothetical protein
MSEWRVTSLNWRSGRTLIIAGSVVISIVVVASILFAGAFFSQAGVAQNFLIQLFKNNERAAYDYLSTDFQIYARSECPTGRITGCVPLIVPEAWGDFEGITLIETDSAQGAQLFHGRWSGLDAPVAIVVLIREENGSQVISGLRGFVLAGGEVDSALLRGERRDNALGDG